MHSAFINMQLTLAGVASAIKSINSICKLRQLARSQGGFARRWLPVLVAGYWLLVTSAFAFAFAFAFQSANKGAKKIPSYDQNKKQKTESSKMKKENRKPNQTKPKSRHQMETKTNRTTPNRTESMA